MVIEMLGYWYHIAYNDQLYIQSAGRYHQMSNNRVTIGYGILEDRYAILSSSKELGCRDHDPPREAHLIYNIFMTALMVNHMSTKLYSM